MGVEAEPGKSACCRLAPGTWHLAAEVVRRKARHHKAFGGVLCVQRLQALVLVGEAAVAGGIDHQHHLARVLAQVLGGLKNENGTRRCRSVPSSTACCPAASGQARAVCNYAALVAFFTTSVAWVAAAAKFDWADSIAFLAWV